MYVTVVKCLSVVSVGKAVGTGLDINSGVKRRWSSDIT
jgi:hypothetical protein